MEYIDITKLLAKDDYYRTDSHWKQENILPVAECIYEMRVAAEMCHDPELDL